MSAGHRSSVLRQLLAFGLLGSWLIGGAWFTRAATPERDDAPPPPVAASNAAAPANGPAPHRDLGPDVVVLDELVDLYEPVPFEHRAHAEMAEMWHGCETCHHRSPDVIRAHREDRTNGDRRQADAVEIPACVSCHPVESDEVDIRVPNLKGAYHRQCLNCHREWTGKNNCVICHEPIHGDGPSAAEPTPDDIVGRMHPPIEAPAVKQYRARFEPAMGRNVLFRHDEHLEGFGLRCVDCHHEDNCSNCHTPSGEVNGAHRPVQPARSWRVVHGPCVACHEQQQCSHCHYSDDEDPPPSFEHDMTGQALDADHADLACRECHALPDFTRVASCGGDECHATAVAYPEDRPGAIVERRMQERTPDFARVARPVIPSGMRDETAWPNAAVLPATDDAPAAPDDAHPEAPLDGGQAGCVREECHAAIRSQPMLHGPVAVNDCDVCHRELDAEAHTFTLLRQGAELCTYCHAFDLDVMPHVHRPVALGECLGCHDPHGGQTNGLLREASVEASCARCHDPMVWRTMVPHTPVGQGDCTSCHAPHGSLFPNLLDAVGPELCLACHQSFDRALGEVAFTHDAMLEGCDRCHATHGSSQPMTLVQPVEQLCVECHEPVAQQVAQATYKHSVVTEDRACVTCHTPHGGDLTALMADLPARICSECHAEPMQTADGRVIGAVPEVLDPESNKHGPIRAGQCGGCHSPHGAARRDLLTADYNREFYARFSEDAYALCFECHDVGFVDPDQTLTGFRNGERNLHTVHVTGRPWGRSCGVCHSTHASGNDVHMRQEVGFRTWEIPINFRKTDTGGSCTPGCHQPFAYDRESAVPERTETVIAREAPLPVRGVRAAQERPTLVRWTPRSIDGKAIDVPHPSRPTVLVLLHTQPGPHRPVLEQVEAALPEAAPVQVVVVVLGPNADAEAKALAEGHGPGWPIVANESTEFAQRLGVRAWPSVLVIQNQGVLLARLGGAPQSLALKLSGYLEQALERPEREELDDDDAAPTIVADTLDGEAIWHMQQARQLFAAGRRESADRALDKAMARQPRAVPLRVELIELLLALDRAAEAERMLEALPASALEPHRRAVLRAGVLVGKDQWDDARALLEQLVERHPRLAPAHQLLGEIYEHEGDWRRAAAAYRAASGD